MNEVTNAGHAGYWKRTSSAASCVSLWVAEMPFECFDHKRPDPWIELEKWMKSRVGSQGKTVSESAVVEVKGSFGDRKIS